MKSVTSTDLAKLKVNVMTMLTMSPLLKQLRANGFRAFSYAWKGYV